MSGVAYAKKIHDANENGILMTECVFAKGKCHRIAANHCAQYKKFFVHVWNHQAEKDFTVRMYDLKKDNTKGIMVLDSKLSSKGSCNKLGELREDFTAMMFKNFPGKNDKVEKITIPRVNLTGC